jgi:hypothetical protein
MGKIKRKCKINWRIRGSLIEKETMIVHLQEWKCTIDETPGMVMKEQRRKLYYTTLEENIYVRNKYFISVFQLWRIWKLIQVLPTQKKLG